VKPPLLGYQRIQVTASAHEAARQKLALLTFAQHEGFTLVEFFQDSDPSRPFAALSALIAAAARLPGVAVAVTAPQDLGTGAAAQIAMRRRVEAETGAQVIVLGGWSAAGRSAGSQGRPERADGLEREPRRAAPRPRRPLVAATTSDDGAESSEAPRSSATQSANLPQIEPDNGDAGAGAGESVRFYCASTHAVRLLDRLPPPEGPTRMVFGVGLSDGSTDWFCASDTATRSWATAVAPDGRLRVCYGSVVVRSYRPGTWVTRGLGLNPILQTNHVEMEIGPW
jgi:hypothetical protein